MQLFVTLTLDRLTASPAELQSAMTEFAENELPAGSFVITGGLASHADGVRIEVSPSGMHQGDPLIQDAYRADHDEPVSNPVPPPGSPPPGS